MTQALGPGREALDRHSWEEAYQELRAADLAAELDPIDLERLADAAWWSGNAEEAVVTLERAYRGHVQAGANIRAAAMALRLAERAMRSVEGSVGHAWLARAERLLEGEPESAVNAWYEFTRTVEALLGRRSPEQAIVHADRAIELGRAHGDPDVENIALSFKGAALTKLGRVEEGLALLDEAAVVATSGQLGAKTACDVYCFTISACRDVSDLRRSQQWTERAERYMEREAIHGYPGACKLHRAELKRLQGKWAEAEDEAREACEELERYRLLDVVGAAHNEIGEVRLRVGDLDGAEEAFMRAYENGWDPQPGLALLHLARGDAAEAARSLERSLHQSGESGYDLVARVQRLPAMVEIALETGDLEGARAAAEELEKIAADHQNSIWTAAAASARGLLDLSEGKIDEAVAHLDAAWRHWRQLDIPYDGAKARLSLGLARRAGGDESGALMEMKAALAVLRQLGASLEVRHVENLIGESRPAQARTTTRKTFMFTDIVTSTDLVGLIGDTAWANLLEWHDRTLQKAFATRGGEVMNHTGDGFFVAFDDAGRAIDSAVEIQRTLHRHRLEHGFAPSIRIGIHAAVATRGEGGGFTGKGVHVAARVGALGEGEQIVVSTETVDGIQSSYPLSGLRTVELKGVAEPIEVQNVDWM